jgi:hypothetical protein
MLVFVVFVFYRRYAEDAWGDEGDVLETALGGL